MTQEEIKERLAKLRQYILDENISTGEILELQGLAKHIDPSDTLLLEWAGVEEHSQGINENIVNILSDTTEIITTQRNIRAYLDDKGNEFFTVFCNEDMFADYGEIYTPQGTIVVDDKECVKIAEYIEEREREL